MGEITSYRDLLVWKQGMNLVVAVYEETRGWPKDELYGLTPPSPFRQTSQKATAARAAGTKFNT